MNKNSINIIVNKIFKQYHSELKAEIDKAETLLAVKRIYDSGKILEFALKRLLEKNLPDYVGITRGIIFSSDCKNNSKEIDLVLYDRRYAGNLIINNDFTDTLSFISIDTVLGVISVKKTITNKSLKDAIENINSVNGLFKEVLTNSLHYDVKLSNELTYQNGKALNNFFLCIVGFKNDFFYERKIVKNKESKSQKVKDSTKIKEAIDKLSGNVWFKNDNRLDFIYTIDGTFFFPLEYNEEKDYFQQFINIEKLGELKEAVEPIKNDNDEYFTKSKLILGYSYDFINPEKILGRFIMYLQSYSSQIIKSSPNFENLIKTFSNPTINDIIENRKIKKDNQ